jgi:uncharacterized protein
MAHPTPTARMRWIAGCLLVLLAAVCAAASAGAAGLVPVPPMHGLVTDLTGTLTGDQQAALETRLRQFDERKGSQVAVLVLPTTAPETIEAYSLRVVEQWKVGRKKVDDGVLLLVAKDDRTVRIEVGYGLEGALPDATAKRIISEVIVPRFRSGDYYGGLDAGVDRIMRSVDGEPLPPPAPQPQEAPDFGRLLPILLLAAFMLGGVLRTALGRLPGATVAAAGVAALAWFLSGLWIVAIVGALAAFFITLGGRGLRPGAYWPGGGGLGGGSGGGFGGGGGGRFGGGGASGRW